MVKHLLHHGEWVEGGIWIVTFGCRLQFEGQGQPRGRTDGYHLHHLRIIVLHTIIQELPPNSVFKLHWRTISSPERSNRYWHWCLGHNFLFNLFPSLTNVLPLYFNRPRPVSTCFAPFGCNFRTDFSSVLHKTTSLLAVQLLSRLNSVLSTAFQPLENACIFASI